MSVLSLLLLGVAFAFVLFMAVVVTVVVKNKGTDDGGPGSMDMGKGPPDSNDSGTF